MKFTSGEVIVQRQLDACNARDVEALLATRFFGFAQRGRAGAMAPMAAALGPTASAAAAVAANGVAA